MLRITLIRHSLTLGNQMGRYIGTTDEPLSFEGVNLLSKNKYPEVEMVYTSPLKRCVQTANQIYPGISHMEIDELKECDFGEFENKNYKELSDNKNYQVWIDSNGELPFPGGEDHSHFKRRCINGFNKAVEDAIRNEYDLIALIVHGGTIMSILNEYSNPHKDFYSWQVKNGQGYLVELSKDNSGIHITIIRDLPE